jgi:hypothetical protein
MITQAEYGTAGVVEPECQFAASAPDLLKSSAADAFPVHQRDAAGRLVRSDAPQVELAHRTITKLCGNLPIRFADEIVNSCSPANLADHATIVFADVPGGQYGCETSERLQIDFR